jgi:ketosteroid isomerase-like protein
MKKLVLLVVLAALAWWYFDGSRKLSEEAIREHYQEQLEATASFDTERLCAAMADDYRVTDVSQGLQGQQKLTMDKAQACDALSQSLGMFKQLSDASGGKFRLDIGYEIKSITVSADRKSASVEGISTFKLGDRLVARTRGTDRLIRRNGKILSQGGDTKTWMYGL